MPIYTLKVLKQGNKIRQQGDPRKAKNIYEFQAKDITNEIIFFDTAYKGKVVLFVNFAPTCSPDLKGPIKELETYYLAREEKALAIGAFLCYQFKQTEPSCQKDLRAFYKRNKINFECFSPVNVNPPNEHPLFTFLKLYNNRKFGSPIRGSYTKFLVNRMGIPVKRYEPHIPFSIIFADIDRELSVDLPRLGIGGLASAAVGSKSSLKSVISSKMPSTKSVIGPRSSKSVIKIKPVASKESIKAPKSVTGASTSPAAPTTPPPPSTPPSEGVPAKESGAKEPLVPTPPKESASKEVATIPPAKASVSKENVVSKEAAPPKEEAPQATKEPATSKEATPLEGAHSVSNAETTSQPVAKGPTTESDKEADKRTDGTTENKDNKDKDKTNEAASSHKTDEKPDQPEEGTPAPAGGAESSTNPS